MDFKYVFISYSTKDQGVAMNVCNYLERNGIRCWIAPRNISAGGNYASQIVSAIKGCSAFVLLASKNTNSSGHVSNEVSIAFDSGKTIIPFKIQDFEFTDEYLYFLGRKHWIEAHADMNRGLEMLRVTLVNAAGFYAPASSVQPQKNTSGKSKNHKIFMAIAIFIAVIFFGTSIMMFTECDKAVESPENPADNVAGITEGTDYHVSRAEILGPYAEFYFYDEEDFFDKTGEIDSYIALVSDSDGEKYFTSISVKRSSELGETLHDYAFEEGYMISGYFRSGYMTSRSDDVSGETAKDYFYDMLSRAGVENNYEKIEWDFEFITESYYDYSAAVKSENNDKYFTPGMVFLELAAGMVFIAVYNGKKNKKA